MDDIKLFKIRRKSDGKFSSGGGKPRFTNVGKIWRKQHLHSHLRMLKQLWSKEDDPIGKFYKDCEVVTLKIIESSSEDLNEYAASNTKL